MSADDDNNSDLDKIIPTIELTQWRAGRVLSEADIAIIKSVLDEMDSDLEESIDLWTRAEDSILLELGGESFRAAYRAKTEADADRMVQEAIAKFHQRVAEEKARRKSQSN